MSPSWSNGEPALFGGVAVVTAAGHIVSATAEGWKNLETLGLVAGLGELFGGMGLPAVFEVGRTTLRCEALEGPEPRVLVTIAMANRLVDAREIREARISGAPGLSVRQREVAVLAARGLRVADIATALGCAQTTVKTHLRATYAALGVSSRVELARVLGDV